MNGGIFEQAFCLKMNCFERFVVNVEIEEYAPRVKGGRIAVVNKEAKE